MGEAVIERGSIAPSSSFNGFSHGHEVCYRSWVGERVLREYLLDM